MIVVGEWGRRHKSTNYMFCFLISQIIACVLVLIGGFSSCLFSLHFPDWALFFFVWRNTACIVFPSITHYDDDCATMKLEGLTCTPYTVFGVSAALAPIMFICFVRPFCSFFLPLCISFLLLSSHCPCGLSFLLSSSLPYPLSFFVFNFSVYAQPILSNVVTIYGMQ